MRVVCLDDNKMFLNELKMLIDNQVSLSSLAEFEFVSSSSDFVVSSVVDDFNILVLDIEMPGVDGFEVAKKVREVNTQVEIIFLTSKDHLVYNSFSFKPFDFVRKSRYSTEFIPCLSRCIETVKSKKSEYTVRFKNTLNLVKYSDTIYIKFQQRRLTYHTVYGDVYSSQPFKTISDHFIKRGFVMADRACLINLEYVIGFRDEEVILAGGIQIVVSRRKLKEFKKKLNLYLLKKGVL